MRVILNPESENPQEANTTEGSTVLILFDNPGERNDIGRNIVKMDSKAVAYLTYEATLLSQRTVERIKDKYKPDGYVSPAPTRADQIANLIQAIEDCDFACEAGSLPDSHAWKQLKKLLGK